MLKLCLFQLRQRFRVGAFGTRRDIRPRRSADAPSLRVATPPRAPEHASARRGRVTGASRDAARASSRRSAPRSFPPPPRVLLCSSALFHAAPRKTNASRAADAPRARRLTPTDANAGVLLARAGTLPTPRAPWPTRSTSPPSGCPSSPSPSRGAFAMPTRRLFVFVSIWACLPSFLRRFVGDSPAGCTTGLGPPPVVTAAAAPAILSCCAAVNFAALCRPLPSSISLRSGLRSRDPWRPLAMP